MVQNTVQIATFGDDQQGIVAGVRNFPIHKLEILCYDEERSAAEEFARRIRSTLGIPVRLLIVSKASVIRDVIERVAEVIRTESDEYEQVLMNVSSGDKMMGCAALSAAFVNGLKAFGMDPEGCPMLLPVLKLSYNEIISDAKVRILQAIDGAGGKVKSLEHLSELSNFGKPLLSYHIQGARDTKGLADLGLVEIERVERGKMEVTLSTLGKLLIANSTKKLENKHHPTA